MRGEEGRKKKKKEDRCLKKGKKGKGPRPGEEKEGAL